MKVDISTTYQKVEPKVKAGAKSVMASGPGALVLIWLLGQTGLKILPEIAVAIGSLITGGLTFLVSYFKK